MIENVIVSGLLHSPEYWRSVVPYLKTEYFRDPGLRHLFETIGAYVDQYSSVPTPQALAIVLEGQTSPDREADVGLRRATEVLPELAPPDVDGVFLVAETEKFCQDRAIENALYKSVEILDGREKKLDRGTIPSMLSEALAVSFDPSVGHSFFDDAEKRFAFYHQVHARVPFDIDALNEITRGGLVRKSLTVLLGGTGVGKTLVMCHLAAANLLKGQNVLYITMEMAEERIAERIDANLLDIPLEELSAIPLDAYQARMAKVRKRTQGRLVIKEYPTACAGSANFRHLLNELRIKKNFVPDIIYIDYLNICMSSRIRMSANVNSYTYVKAIAEEVRGLAVEFNVPIVTATQTNREGFVSSDPGLENTSESFGLPATADLMLAIISSKELAVLRQIMFKQLKNRYSDPSDLEKFVVGVDKTKMRLFNVTDARAVDTRPSSISSSPSSVPKKPSLDFSAFS